ncbi:MAG: hypothetical protein MHPSP_001510, partial [Paramarteilia canceri]
LLRFIDAIVINQDSEEGGELELSETIFNQMLDSFDSYYIQLSSSARQMTMEMSAMMANSRPNKDQNNTIIGLTTFLELAVITVCAIIFTKKVRIFLKSKRFA